MSFEHMTMAQRREWLERHRNFCHRHMTPFTFCHCEPPRPRRRSLWDTLLKFFTAGSQEGGK